MIPWQAPDRHRPGGGMAQLMLGNEGAMPPKPRPAVSPRPSCSLKTGADALTLEEESGVRAVPRASLPPPHPAALRGASTDASEPPQAEARIEQLGPEAAAQLEEGIRQQQEAYREELAWRAKMREAKERLQEEAEWEATLAAAKAQHALAFQAERDRQEDTEWQAAFLAAKRRQDEI